jgi:hypothetical protein
MMRNVTALLRPHRFKLDTTQAVALNRPRMSTTATHTDTPTAVADAAVKLLDRLTSKHTAFNHFTGLIDAAGGYRPTFNAYAGRGKYNEELRLLADAYDHAQTMRGDNRRANRVN